MGHLISSQDSRSLQKKLLKVESFSCPKCKREVSQFMGLTNWYRYYILALFKVDE